MADKAHALTDEKLEEMEKHLTAIYERSKKEIGKDWKAYMKESSKEIEGLQKAYDEAKKSGNENEIRRTGINLSRAKREQTVQNERYKKLTEKTANELLHVNERAMAYINGSLADVYALNYNALAPEVDGIVDGYSFTLTDAQTVKNLSTKDDTLLPYKEVNGVKDVRWNTKQINAEVLQGILAGEPIDKIADRIENVTESNRKSAIRNARTTVTSAENKGRLDSYEQAQKEGIIMQKEWISSDQPGRTRDWHLPGAFKKLIVDTDKPFVNEIGEIRYPGDPTADGANVWNCRCTMAAVIKGFRKANGEIIYIDEEDKRESLEKYYDKWEGKLTLSEKKTVGRYQSESFAFNQNLRGEGWSESGFRREFGMDLATRKEISDLDNAIRKASLPYDVVVYRGTPDRVGFEGIKKGDIIEDRGFMSTSLNKNVPFDYGGGEGVILEIDVPKGSKCAYVSNIKDSTGRNFYDNEEILFHKGSKLKITRVEEMDGYLKVNAKYIETSETSKSVKKASSKKTSNKKTSSKNSKNEFSVEGLSKRKIVELKNELIDESGLSVMEVANMSHDELEKYLKKYNIKARKK